jgi:heat shock protein HslJ
MKGKIMKLINTLTMFTWALVMLVACGTTSSDPLNGTTWELYSIGSYSPISGSKTTIHFEDSQVSGLGGCNQYGGEYQINGNRLTFSALYMTEMACMSPEGIMDQEQRFLQSLGDASSFEIMNGQLQISLPDGETLTFVRVE